MILANQKVKVIDLCPKYGCKALKVSLNFLAILQTIAYY